MKKQYKTLETIDCFLVTDFLIVQHKLLMADIDFVATARGESMKVETTKVVITGTPEEVKNNNLFHGLRKRYNITWGRRLLASVSLEEIDMVANRHLEVDNE